MTNEQTLNVRRRLEWFNKGSGEWDPVTVAEVFDPSRMALLICDMWDDHWCKAAARRASVLAEKMVPVIESARARGIQIIHAPSDCMAFYADTPQRRMMQDLPEAEMPEPQFLKDPPLPIDDSDGGCDDADSPEPTRAWTRQNSSIRIAPEDGITERGVEVYNLLRHRDCNLLLMMGVHTNMCILNRSFGIRAMTRLGVNCLLVRDLTDAMYNPACRPFVSHEAGTELVVQHIERYWCPTILSKDLI